MNSRLRVIQIAGLHVGDGRGARTSVHSPLQDRPIQSLDHFFRLAARVAAGTHPGHIEFKHILKVEVPMDVEHHLAPTTTASSGKFEIAPE